MQINLDSFVNEMIKYNIPFDVTKILKVYFEESLCRSNDKSRLDTVTKDGSFYTKYKCSRCKIGTHKRIVNRKFNSKLTCYEVFVQMLKVRYEDFDKK